MILNRAQALYTTVILNSYATECPQNLLSTDNSGLCFCIIIFAKGNIEMVMSLVLKNLIAPNAISFTLKLIVYVKLIATGCKGTHCKYKCSNFEH